MPETVIPEITRAGHTRLARLSFTRPVERLTLLAGAAAPAETDPDSEDWRELEPLPGGYAGRELWSRLAALRPWRRRNSGWARGRNCASAAPGSGFCCRWRRFLPLGEAGG